MKDDNSWNFREWHGTIYSFIGDRMHVGYHTLAFVFDRGHSGTLYKWGEYESVSKWMSEAILRYKDLDFIEESENFTLISKVAEGPGKWDVDIINRFIDIGGFIGRWYETSEFKELEIELAPQVMVDQYDDIANHFIPKILGIKRFLITDESSLLDFNFDIEDGKIKRVTDDTLKEIEKVYDVDVSDIEELNLMKIFERLRILSPIFN